MVFDMVYNGNSPDQAILSQVEITAHRGSSKHAPENTMAAIEEAIGEMADTARSMCSCLKTACRWSVMI